MSSKQTQLGFFRRIFGKVTEGYYARSMFNRQNYLQNWNSIKWKVRFAKISFLGFAYLSMNFFVTDLSTEKTKQLEEAYDTLHTLVEQNKENDAHFVIKGLMNQLEKFFKIERVDFSNSQAKLLFAIFKEFSPQLTVSELSFYFVEFSKKSFYWELDEDDPMRVMIEFLNKKPTFSTPN